MGTQMIANPPGFGTPNFQNQKLSRSKYRELLTDKTSTAWQDLKDEGEETNLPFEALLRKKCQKAEPGRPQNVIYDMMASEDMYPGSSRIKPALTVKQCINTPFRANLVFAHWDKLYDDQFQLQANRNSNYTKEFASGTGVTADSTVPGSVYRPYGEQRGMVRNKTRRIPDIALAQVISGTTVQATDLIRQTRFEVLDQAGSVVTVPEMGDFPEINFTQEQDAAGMRKIGVRLNSSRESKFREALVSDIDRVIAQVSVMQEHNLTVAAVKQIYDARSGAKITGIAKTIRGILDIATRAVNGYSIDTLLMRRATMLDWLETQITLPGTITATARPTDPGTENRVGGIFGSIEILNDLQAGNRIGFLQDTDAQTAGILANEMLGWNREDTLDFYQQAQGMVDEEVYMVPNQAWARVISMIYGQKIWDPNSIACYVLS